MLLQKGLLQTSSMPLGDVGAEELQSITFAGKTAIAASEK